MRGLEGTRPLPAATGSGAETRQSKVTAKDTRPALKINRVLKALMDRSFNRFEAARELSDWCLHSTVSEIQDRKGIAVAREWETVPGYQGIPTRVCRYWLAQEERQKAAKLLGVGDGEEPL